MYREALWRYLRFIRETRRQKDVCNENENEEDATRDASDDTEMMNDNVFHDLMQTSDIPPPSHSISNTDIIAKNFESLSEHNTMKRNMIGNKTVYINIKTLNTKRLPGPSVKMLNYYLIYIQLN